MLKAMKVYLRGITSRALSKSANNVILCGMVCCTHQPPALGLGVKQLRDSVSLQLAPEDVDCAVHGVRQSVPAVKM
jgi:hypothetical protein